MDKELSLGSNLDLKDFKKIGIQYLCITSKKKKKRHNTSDGSILIIYMGIILTTMWSQLPFFSWGLKITTSISKDLKEKLRHAVRSQIPHSSYFQSK